MKIRERLETLERLNANPAFVNKQLYRLLYSEELYVIAYEHLRSNKGAMTAGISKKHGTADGLNMGEIRRIIESLKDQSYQPKPARRVYIPKANGKTRPLGMPDFKDKLVQECINIILTCIYDSKTQPTFLPTSLGFRKDLGCHHALKKAHDEMKGIAWVIKADVKAFFDEVDHHTLMTLLKRRIADQRFINLIWKLLRCGYMEDGQLYKPKKGTPQGGNVSPILTNIYLHEFDLFIEELKISLGTQTRTSPRYSYLTTKLDRAKKAVKETPINDILYKDRVAMVSEFSNEIRRTPSTTLEDPNKAVFNYIRYADDWILGLKCSKATAQEIYNRCKTFFKTKLHLNWNEEKSILARSTDQDFEFLGVNLHFANRKQVRVIKMKSPKGRTYKKRTIGVNHLHFLINAENIFARLRKKGFVNRDNKPISCKKLINQDIIEIVKYFKSTMRGIENYYRFVSNIQQLNHIHYVLFMSLCKTLAHKGKTTKRQIMKKYGGRILTFRYGKDQKKELTVTMSGGLTTDLRAFNIKEIRNDRDPVRDWYVSQTSRWLNTRICGLCGDKGYTEMHHVKHIKRRGRKYQGFDRVMRAINRKQVPLCLGCHSDVHNGKHDGINVREAANQFYKNLGFNKWEDREIGLTKSTKK